MVRTCTGLVWVRSSLRSPSGPGLQEEGVVHLPRRVLGREVQGREVVKIVLDVRALRPGRSPARRRWRSSRPSPAWSDGRTPLRRGGAGRVRSRRPAARRASSSAASSAALRAAMAAGDPVAQAVDQRPLVARSSGLIDTQGFEQGRRPRRSFPAPRPERPPARRCRRRRRCGRGGRIRGRRRSVMGGEFLSLPTVTAGPVPAEPSWTQRVDVAALARPWLEIWRSMGGRDMPAP